MKEHYFHIIGRRGCPYCTHAERLLNEKNLDFTSEVLERGSSELNEAKKRYNWSTVPIINHVMVANDGVIQERFVGGFSDLVAYLREGGGVV